MSGLEPELCENGHNYQSMGLVFTHETRNIPGSGAFRRIYEDKLFCSRCLEVRYTNPRVDGNSYGLVLYGAAPK